MSWSGQSPVSQCPAQPGAAALRRAPRQRRPVQRARPRLASRLSPTVPCAARRPARTGAPPGRCPPGTGRTPGGGTAHGARSPPGAHGPPQPGTCGSGSAGPYSHGTPGGAERHPPAGGRVPGCPCLRGCYTWRTEGRGRSRGRARDIADDDMAVAAQGHHVEEVVRCQGHGGVLREVREEGAGVVRCDERHGRMVAAKSDNNPQHAAHVHELSYVHTARAARTSGSVHRQSVVPGGMTDHEKQQPAPRRGKVLDALVRAERATVTRSAPRSAKAQVKFLLTRVKGSTRALAERLGVSHRTVERCTDRGH